MNPNYDAVIEDFKQMIADAEAGIRAIERLKAMNVPASGVMPSMWSFPPCTVRVG